MVLSEYVRRAMLDGYGYSLLEIKSVDDEQRIIEGVASTPELDTVGDIMEPAGAKFSLPMPLLWFHNQESPIGEVLAANVRPDGIHIRAQIKRDVLPYIDKAWALIKSGLVKGLSIGFGRDVDNPPTVNAKGHRHFKSWRWRETSAVTIPANTSANILIIKSLDAPHRTASGSESAPVSSLAGASAPSPVIIAARKGAGPMNVAERITQYETKRAADQAALVTIQTKVTEEGRTKDETEREQFDALTKSIESVDLELKDLRMLESHMKAAAVPANGTSPAAASTSRGGMVVEVKSNLPKGTGFTRYAMALAASRGNRMEAVEFAKRWEKTTPEVVEVLKAAVVAGTTTDSDWAAPLVVYRNLAAEFIELLRPATLIGRIAGFNRVPFNVTMPRQLTGSTVGWVGQGKPKPVGELSFDQVSLGMAKAAGIVVIAEELARSSDPAAEGVVQRDLTAAIAQFLDLQFVDPSVAAVTNVSPASVTNGATVVDSTGTTAAAFRTDFATALAVFSAADLPIAGTTVLMTETQAMRLGMIVNAFGQPEFPGIGATGGTLFGLNVVTSENIPAEGGSPGGERIILLKPSEIFLAEGGIMLDVSREAAVQMNTTPDDPATASTVLVSLWQNNLVGIRVERFINWLKRRSAAVVVIEGAVYTG